MTCGAGVVSNVRDILLFVALKIVEVFCQIVE